MRFYTTLTETCKPKPISIGKTKKSDYFDYSKKLYTARKFIKCLSFTLFSGLFIYFSWEAKKSDHFDYSKKQHAAREFIKCLSFTLFSGL